MKLSILAGLVGLSGGLGLASGGGALALPRPDQDTCTSAVVCQTNVSVTGSFNAQGTQAAGSCKCDEGDCLTKHCKVDLNVTLQLPAGASYKVVGTGPCNSTQEAPFNLVVNNCSSAGSMTRLVYLGSTDCSTNGAWWSYTVSCGKGNCGDFNCPNP